MNRSISGLAAAFVVLAASLLPNTPARAQSMQVVVNGQPRVFVLNRPAGAQARPTIIMLHGTGSNAAREANAPGLGQLAPQHGFAAVFAEGLGGIGTTCRPARRPESSPSWCSRGRVPHPTT